MGPARSHAIAVQDQYRALRRPALNTINKILTEPTDEDLMRRLYGQQFRDQILHRDADFPVHNAVCCRCLGIRI